MGQEGAEQDLVSMPTPSQWSPLKAGSGLSQCLMRCLLPASPHVAEQSDHSLQPDQAPLTGQGNAEQLLVCDGSPEQGAPP